jgi:osmoprotectant transport system substrate-binding protein
MLEKYDLALGKDVPQGNVKTLATGAIYAATDKGECNFGEIFTTDGRIKALDLTVLEDDRQFFPKYNVATVFRKEVLDEHPDLEKLFAPVSAKLDDKTLIELNAQVDVDGRDPVDVAHAWLKQEGFLAS